MSDEELVDRLEVEVGNDGAAVLVENGGAIVVARTDAETRKDDVDDALEVAAENLDLANYVRSTTVESVEEARKMRADGGRP